MRYYVYLTINHAKESLYLETGNSQYVTTRYIGSKSIDDKNYFGSSKSLIRDINIYGIKNFEKIILFELLNNDPIELLNFEYKIQLDHNVVESNRYYNKIYATQNFTSRGYNWYHSPDTNEKEKFLETDVIPIDWIKGSGYSTISGSTAYHDPITSKISYFKPTDIIPNNLIRGFPIGHTSNLKWFHNPLNPTERVCSENCPIDWIDGMGDLPNHPTKGKNFTYYYDPMNPTKWIKITDGDLIPDELIKGRIGNGRIGRKWFHDPTNPSKRGYYLPDKAPIGWIHGKGFVSGGRPNGAKSRNKLPE